MVYYLLVVKLFTPIVGVVEHFPNRPGSNRVRASHYAGVVTGVLAAVIEGLHESGAHD